MTCFMQKMLSVAIRSDIYLSKDFLLCEKLEVITTKLIYRRFRTISKMNMSFVMSVRPRGTNRFPLDGFLWNWILEDFSKIRPENSRFIKIGQEKRALYVKTNIFFYHISLISS
jgi:hypothetical protein